MVVSVRPAARNEVAMAHGDGRRASMLGCVAIPCIAGLGRSRRPRAGSGPRSRGRGRGPRRCIGPTPCRIQPMLSMATTLGVKVDVPNPKNSGKAGAWLLSARLARAAHGRTRPRTHMPAQARTHAHELLPVASGVAFHAHAHAHAHMPMRNASKKHVQPGTWNMGENYLVVAL